ncbi:fibronectin-like [Paramisgurnus dabryanus]|uniref:fibronectin-like n=1 Tax=Paramisgurnus dabryanus TaxID=90735 RepID=UPI0031F41BA5
MHILWPTLLLGSVVLAEEQYFLNSSATTWDEARDHCQACFKDLATITYRNIHLILQNLNSEYWIGLRRRFNDSKPWSRWSNGDYVTYQNWYPGHPVRVKTCSSTTTSTLDIVLTSNSPVSVLISTPVSDSTSTPVTDSTSTPVTDSTSFTLVTDSTSNPINDLTNTPVNDLTSTSTNTTLVTDSTSTPVSDSSSTSRTDSTSITLVTDSASTPVTDSATTPVTDSTSTPVTDSTSTLVTDSTSTPINDLTNNPVNDLTSTNTTLVTDSSSTQVSDSTSITLVTDSTSTPVSDSTSTPINDLTNNPVNDLTSTSTNTTLVTDSTSTYSSSTPVTDSSRTPVSDSTSITLVTDSTSTPVTDSSSTPVSDSTSITLETDSTSTSVTDSNSISLMTDSTRAPVNDSTSTTPVTDLTSTPMNDSTSITPLNDSTNTTLVTDSTSTPVTDSASTEVTDSTSTPVTDSTSTEVTDSTSTPVSDSTSTPINDLTNNPVNDLTSTSTNTTLVTDSTSTLVTYSSSTPVTDSASTEVTDSTSTPVSDSTSITLVTDSTSTLVTYSSSTPVTDSASTEVTDSTSTPVTDSTSTEVTDSTSTEVTDSTSTEVTDSTSTPVTDSTSTEVTDSTSTPVNDSTSTTPLNDSNGTTLMTAPNSSTPMSSTTSHISSTEDQRSLLTQMPNFLNMKYSINKTGTIVSSASQPLCHKLLRVNIIPSIQKICDDDEEYIEDACVALLIYGMWIERNCNENIPFICYEERFMGEIHISNVTKTEGYLSWSPAPGEITHYRVEVTADLNQTFNSNETGLSKQLLNLKEATRYDVQVFPVKCGRDLNPQNISFYTIPSGVYNLNVMKVTNKSVELSWDHSGGYDIYSVNVSDVSKLHNANESTIVISDLTPAKMYNFTVTAIVNGTTESVSESVSTYTKPSPVLNLKSADKYDTVINAFWTKPSEILSGYRVCLNENNIFCSNCSDCEECSECVNCTNTNSTAAWINFTGKTPDTKYILCVASLTNNNEVQGEMVQIDAYTCPKKVANLSLSSTNQSITANWNFIETYKRFNVSIKADCWVGTSNVTNQSSYTFNDLRGAVSYTVTVITLSEKYKLESDPAERSVYTTPSAVYNLNVMKVTNESVELSWDHSGGYDFYSVNVSEVIKLHTANTNKIVIPGLTPAKMYNFTVTAIVNGATESVPEGVSTYTKPSPVMNLKSADEYETIINAFWTKPNENLSGYRFCLNENNLFCNNCSVCVNWCNTNSTDEWINFPGKTPGTKYILCVAALTNNNELQGEIVQIDAYTRPSNVANLSLTSTNHSITANWLLNEGYKSFNVSINADDWDGTSIVTNQSSYTFNELQAAESYTITVITLSKKYELESDGVEQSVYTKPSPVLNLTSADNNETIINASWTKPNEILSGYRVCLNEKNIFCSNCSACEECSECVNCIITTTTAAWINFPDKTPGTKYILCVAALTNNNEVQGEMVQIDAYTRPSKVAYLYLTSTNHSITANWLLNKGYKSFNVSIKADDWVGTTITYQTSYTFNDLQAAVSYTVTVITLSEKYKLESDPAELSLYTKPSPVLNLKSADEYDTIINAFWTKPSEILSGYRVCLNENNIFCNKCSDCNDCSECVNCIITTAEWIKFTGKTPGTKYILCVAALTNNNETQGEMVQIDAYTRPSKVADLSLSSTIHSITANWLLTEGYKSFNVSIKADGWVGTFIVTDQSSYTFNELQAAVNYTITVITLSEKNKLDSDPAKQSVYTELVSPGPATATVLDHTAINVTWGVPTELTGNSTITYNVTVHSEYWQKYDTSHLTQNRFIIFNDLKSGTKYTFSVSVVAGKNQSAPVFAYGMTVPNKTQVTFAVMCTSETSLYCSKSTTLTEIKEELENQFGNKYKDVYWKLEKIDRK